jgi:hypothetical protein
VIFRHARADKVLVVGMAAQWRWLAGSRTVPIDWQIVYSLCVQSET